MSNGTEPFRSLVDNALDLIAVLSADGTIRWASPSFGPTLGYDPNEVIGRNLFTLGHADDSSALSTFLAELNDKTGANVSIECRFRHRVDGWRMFEAVGKNLLDDPAVA